MGCTLLKMIESESQLAPCESIGRQNPVHKYRNIEITITRNKENGYIIILELQT